MPGNSPETSPPLGGLASPRRGPAGPYGLATRPAPPGIAPVPKRGRAPRASAGVVHSGAILGVDCGASANDACEAGRRNRGSRLFPKMPAGSGGRQHPRNVWTLGRGGRPFHLPFRRRPDRPRRRGRLRRCEFNGIQSAASLSSADSRQLLRAAYRHLALGWPNAPSQVSGPACGRPRRLGGPTPCGLRRRIEGAAPG
jgi:hypothetical protein